MVTEPDWLIWARELQALAQTGLAFNANLYDRERYEMLRALEGIGQLWERARKAGVGGNREYNPGWHTALDLKNLLTVSEAVTRSAIERKESRGAQFRDDYPRKDDAQWGNVNIVLRKAADGTMQIRREPILPMPEHLKQVVEEMK